MKTPFNKKIVTAVLAGLLTVSVIPMTSHACRRGGGGQGGGCAMKGGQNGKNFGFGGALGIWRDVQLVRDLGLNDEQVRKLKETDFFTRGTQQTLRAELDSLNLKMDQAFAADNADEDAIRELSKKIAATKGQMIEQRTETRLTLRKLLTPEQLDKFNSQLGSGSFFCMGNGTNKPCMMNGQGRGNGMKKSQ